MAIFIYVHFLAPDVNRYTFVCVYGQQGSCGYHQQRELKQTITCIKRICITRTNTIWLMVLVDSVNAWVYCWAHAYYYVTQHIYCHISTCMKVGYECVIAFCQYCIKGILYYSSYKHEPYRSLFFVVT